MTTTRQINTLREAAKVILEEREKGLYPIDFSLPLITFSDEGKMAKLSPYLQAIVEENMGKLETGKITNYRLSLKGLIDVAEGKPNPEKGKDVAVMLDKAGDIAAVQFSEEPDVSKLSYPNLIKLKNVIDTKCLPKNNPRWRYAKYLTVKRITKLKGEL